LGEDYSTHWGRFLRCRESIKKIAGGKDQIQESSLLEGGGKLGRRERHGNEWSVVDGSFKGSGRGSLHKKEGCPGR